MTDRTNAPELIIPEKLKITEAQKLTLDNGLGLYVINAGNEEVIRFEIIFPSGADSNNSYSLSTACHQLIDSGTHSKKAIEIAEHLDFYGAYLHIDSGPDWKSISLFTISRFFDETIAIIYELLTEAIFPESEIDTWKVRNTQTLKVNHEKVSWLSKTTFNAAIYGKDHPYGYTPDEQNIESVNGADLRNYYKTAYNFNNAILVLAGKTDEKIINKINAVFGHSAFIRTDVSIKNTGIPIAHRQDKLYTEKKDSVQSGVRIGKQMFPKSHPDYITLSIANTILGGYFGSRLMSNIREDKGYTYGIGSAVVPMRNSGAFFISTETGNEVREAAIKEIYFEIQKMIDQPVPAEELLLVKNYLFGSFQRSLDGPFSLADRFKGLILHGLEYDYLYTYLRLLNEITPLQIMEICERHLQPATMSEIVAG